MRKKSVLYWLAIAFAFLLSSSSIEAQIIKIDPGAIAIGGGSMLGEEDLTFSWEAAFAAIQWHGVAIASNNASTGIGVEIHPAAVFTYFENEDDNLNVQAIENVDWRLWSLNRVKTSVFQIPGEIWEQMYVGTDLLVAEGGSTDFSGDFSARFVYGVADGPIEFEIYMFEKYRPISFAFFYRF